MTLLRLAAACTLLSLSAAGLAEDAGATSPEASAEDKGEKPKKVCRMETATGSVMPRRVCRTPEEIAANEEAARVARDRMDRGITR